MEDTIGFWIFFDLINRVIFYKASNIEIVIKLTNYLQMNKDSAIYEANLSKLFKFVLKIYFFFKYIYH